MKLSALFALALSALGAVAASSHQKRDVGGVLLCVGANATGECVYQVTPLQTCTQLAPPFFHNTRTFLVDGDGFYCSPHVYACNATCMSNMGCDLGELDWQSGGRYDLEELGWTDTIGAFDCWPYENVTATSTEADASAATDPACGPECWSVDRIISRIREREEKMGLGSLLE